MTDRPLYPHQFVVAPLAPDGPHIKPHHFDAVEEPNGIVAPKDPARAAAHVARRVLPRYEQALQEVLDNTVAQPEAGARRKCGSRTSTSGLPTATQVPRG